MENDYSSETENTPKKNSRTPWAIWAIVFLLAFGNVYAIWQIGETQSRLAQVDKSLQTSISTINEQASLLNTKTEEAAAELRKSLEDSLDQAAKQAKKVAGHAKTQAERRAEQLVQKLAEETRALQTEFSTEIGQVKESASDAHQRVAAVMNDVSSVRGDVSQNRTDLEATRTELKSVRGDLGVQSGLIATNAKELAALRELGERDYFEFNISKTGQATKVGNVALTLRKSKPKDNKFTVYVVADDKRVEKKDKTINEPIQFYTTGSRLPYEIVVNEVKKDGIVGYLAVPKVLKLQAKR